MLNRRMTFIARLVVRPGMEAKFEGLQRELSELTHSSEPDVLVYDVIKHRTEPSYIRRVRTVQERSGVSGAHEG